MNRTIYQAVRVEYSGSPNISVSVDALPLISAQTLPYHSTFRGRRITLPVTSNNTSLNYSGFISHLESSSTQLQNENFEGVPIESFSQQQLFHYYDVGFRGTSLQPEIYLDEVAQTKNFQTVNGIATTISTSKKADTVRVYFDQLAYGYIPHIHNLALTDAEILWARPVALPPRFYRGIRTHAEFQITYKGDVDIQWYLDGTSIGTYNFDSTEVVGQDSNGNDITDYITKTEKAYFQSGTIGHVLQYIHTNPEDGGKIYIVETDVTLADLEQRAMTPQAEEG